MQSHGHREAWIPGRPEVAMASPGTSASGVTLAPDPVEILSRGRRLVEPALKEAVARLHPELGRIAAYHLGWADAAGSPVPGGGGKAVRPTLAMLSAEAGEQELERAIPGAVAVELVHNFSILHDDVMDGDRTRRHRPTAWVVFGTGPAVLAGDALVALASEVLLGSTGSAPAAELLTGAVSELILGQIQDLALEQKEDTCLAEYLEMSAHKTSALFACSASIGAVLTGAPVPTVRGLAAFGRHLGLLFQAVDDLLGIWGSEGVTGKPVHSDLRRRKKSLPIVAALTAGLPESAELRAIFSMDRPSETQVRRAAFLVEAAGGRSRAEEEVERCRAAAIESLEGLEIPGSARADLMGLTEYLAIRTR